MKSISLVWPTDSRVVTQHFGLRPEFYGAFGLPGHEGIDLRARTNANLYALADGTVTFAGFPTNNPYGLHIRMTHQQNGVTFYTIYAHLEKALVKKGDTVTAGQLIGLSDNSGNSQGSHLHLTLKIKGEQTGKYPPGVVDPWPYLKDAPGAQQLPPDTPPATDLVVYTTVELFIRAKPINGEILTLLGVSEPLTVLGNADSARNKLGVEGEWIQVQTSSNLVGYVAAWFVEEKDSTAKPSGVIVYPFTKLNVRAGKGLNKSVLGTVDIGDPLMTIGSAEIINQQLGQKNEWLRIEADSGLRGYVAAEGVHRSDELPPLTGLTLYPTDILSVRAQPTTASNRIGLVTASDELEVLGSADEARLLVKQADAWLNIKTATGLIGYVSAKYVQSAHEASFTPPEETPYLGVVTTITMPLYAQCSDDAVQLAILSAKTELDILDSDLTAARITVGQADNWLYVETIDGVRGWVMTESLVLATE